MAAPYRAFPVLWELPVTADMASDVNLAASTEGTPRIAWVREAIQQRLDRERKKAKR